MRLFGPAKIFVRVHDTLTAVARDRLTDRRDPKEVSVAHVVREGDRLILWTPKHKIDQRYRIEFSASDMEDILSAWDRSPPPGV